MKIGHVLGRQRRRIDTCPMYRLVVKSVNFACLVYQSVCFQNKLTKLSQNSYESLFCNDNITRVLFFLCGFYLQLDTVIHHSFYLAVTVLILSLYILGLFNTCF